MNTSNKRKDIMEDDKTHKRVKKVCSYGDNCYRKNPAHFREFSHPHLEAILDEHKPGGDYPIPPKYSLQKYMIKEQLDVIVEKQLYIPVKNVSEQAQASCSSTSSNTSVTNREEDTKKIPDKAVNSNTKTLNVPKNNDGKISPRFDNNTINSNKDKKPTDKMERTGKIRDSDYRPIVPPTRRAEDYLNVVPPKGKMAAKHAASAPYHIFYTTITAAKETHSQVYSITFQEILDHSLGELKCSLQINFMVEIGWLLAQYYFAGYSEKKLTILYGDDCGDLKDINKKKPQVDAYYVSMPTPFGKHHTKLMLLCYEDGSLRVVVSTANLYIDDWENRTQGLWFSPNCPELPRDAMPHDGESPTMFKKSLLRYLNHYHMAQLTYYVERVKRCDFSHINVFLITSAPGSHFDTDWGMTRVGSLLRQHCCIPPEENKQWPLLAQASSLGSYGKEAKLWLTGDFLHNFTKIKNQSQMLSSPPQLKLIYPSLENVKNSHDDLLGGGCLPYAAEAHSKQPWLINYLYQWKATSTKRDRAMPHIKSYTRVSEDNKRAAYFLLTSGNISKAAWGSLNKGNGALRVMSYEAGVLFLPRFVINEDFFPLEDNTRLVLPYDVPPTKYSTDMSPWLICFWCVFLAASVRAQDYYAPQTFRQNLDQKGLFTPSGRNDVIPQGSSNSWRPGPSENWKGQSSIPKTEPWRLPYGMNKEQQAHILHHKQALSSDGNFRFEYASDNGLAAGEVIEPDGSRVGGYQYKDPSGQLVKLKYRAGKDGFQILEGSHLPKSPEPVAPVTQDSHYQQAYVQQRQQYNLQQQHNQQRPEPQQPWRQDQAYEGGHRPASTQFYAQNWRPQGDQDDGQYRDNEVVDKGPHSFGSGYAFAFQG